MQREQLYSADVHLYVPAAATHWVCPEFVLDQVRNGLTATRDLSTVPEPVEEGRAFLGSALPPICQLFLRLLLVLHLRQQVKLLSFGSWLVHVEGI